MKALATLIMWMVYLGSLGFLGQTLDLGAWVILMAGVLMIPLILINLAMWEAFHGTEKQANSSQVSNQADSLEKRKRDRLDAVLRDLSDEQLAALKTRLSEPNFEDEVRYMLGDDGELLTKR